MHNFVVHSNENVCRKNGRLGLEQVYWQFFCLDISIWSAARADGAYYMKIFSRNTLTSSERSWNIPSTRFFLADGIKSTRQVTIHYYLTDASSIGQSYLP